MTDPKMKIEEIGKVFSCFKAKFGTPRQSSLVRFSNGYIEIHKKWEPAKCLKGLEEFSHIWVLFWFHGNTNLEYKPVVRPPRLDGKGVGALATRSPLRPNPIGLSLVKLDRVEKNRVYISGLDIIEGTPVLDIKPYIHFYDSTSGSKAGWVEEVGEQALEVEFSEQALQELEALQSPNLRQNIEDILKSDIRNRSDKRNKNPKKHLGFYFEDLNVVFHSSDTKVQVLRIEKMYPKKERIYEEANSR